MQTRSKRNSAVADSGRKVLIVEDDARFCASLSESLNGRDVSAVRVSDLASAMRAMRHNGVALALIGLDALQQSGVSLFPILKRLSFDLKVFVLATRPMVAGGTHRAAGISANAPPNGARRSDGASEEPANRTSEPSLDDIMWEHIERVLARHGGNVSAAARALGLHRRTLQRKLQKSGRGSYQSMAHTR